MKLIKDIYYDIKQFLFTIIVLILAFFILKNQFSILFNKDYNINNSITNNTEVKSEIDVSEIKKETSPDISITIPAESSMLDISKILIDTGIINDEASFVELVKTKGMENSLNTGEFNLNKSMTNEEIIEILK